MHVFDELAEIVEFTSEHTDFPGGFDGIHLAVRLASRFFFEIVDGLFEA